MKTAAKAMALISLVLLLADEGSGFLRSPWRLRLETLLVSANRTLEERRIEESRLPFDPDYGPFLEAVRNATPPGSTVALLAPGTNELYIYQANYLLAPRRLVGSDSLAEANYAAVYGTGAVPGRRIPLPAARGDLFQLR